MIDIISELMSGPDALADLRIQLPDECRETDFFIEPTP
jgi:hypothetical protein